MVSKTHSERFELTFSPDSDSFAVETGDEMCHEIDTLSASTSIDKDGDLEIKIFRWDNEIAAIYITPVEYNYANSQKDEGIKFSVNFKGFMTGQPEEDVEVTISATNWNIKQYLSEIADNTEIINFFCLISALYERAAQDTMLYRAAHVRKAWQDSQKIQDYIANTPAEKLYLPVESKIIFNVTVPNPEFTQMLTEEAEKALPEGILSSYGKSKGIAVFDDVYPEGTLMIAGKEAPEQELPQFYTTIIPVGFDLSVVDTQYELYLRLGVWELGHDDRFDPWEISEYDVDEYIEDLSI